MSDYHCQGRVRRILRYSGVCDGPAGARPVSVLFAVDVRAATDNAAVPAVRITGVDEQTRR